MALTLHRNEQRIRFAVRKEPDLIHILVSVAVPIALWYAGMVALLLFEGLTIGWYLLIATGPIYVYLGIEWLRTRKITTKPPWPWPWELLQEL